MKSFKLFLESKLDGISTTIVRAIVRGIRDNFDFMVENDGMFLWYGNIPELHGSKIAKHLDLSEINYNILIIIEKQKEDVSVSGSYSSNRNLIRANIKTPFDKKSLSNIWEHLVDLIRHELEHTIQSKEMLSKSNIANKDLFKNINNLETYLTDPGEVEAFVVAFAKIAKSTKQTFFKVIDDYLKGKRWHWTIIYNVSIDEIDKLAEDIKKVWLDYAKKRQFKIN